MINTIDLAPYVGASLDAVDSDTKIMRIDKPYVSTNIKVGQGLAEIIAFIIKEDALER